MAFFFYAFEVTLYIIMSKRVFSLAISLSLLSLTVFSQLRVDFATDLSILRNFTPGQKFWAIGQNLKLDFFPTMKDGIYISGCYYSDGKFKNQLTAVAKSPATNPQEIQFVNHARMRIRIMTIGWKHFLKGDNEAENFGWNLYGIAGFGMLFGKAFNEYSTVVDTSLYTLPAQPVGGEGHFKRLTIDLGLGYEYPLVMEIFLYAEARVSIPTSEYPSKYLAINNNAPFPGMLSAGIRMIF
jgi:hypothetical protein